MSQCEVHSYGSRRNGMCAITYRPTMSPFEVHSETVLVHGSIENRSKRCRSGTHIFITIFLGDKPQAALIEAQFAILECTTRRPTKKRQPSKSQASVHSVHRLAEMNSPIHGQADG
jgi:hypothetical protein